MNNENKTENVLNPVATGVAWKYEKSGKTFLSAKVDFGLLGESQFFIFKRDKSKNKNQEKNNPDYTICKSYKEDGFLNSIGSLWLKQKEKEDGEIIKYLSGSLSAGVHGEYIIHITNINYKEEKKEDSPDKRIRIYTSKELKSKSNTLSDQDNNISF